MSMGSVRVGLKRKTTVNVTCKKRATAEQENTRNFSYILDIFQSGINTGSHEQFDLFGVYSHNTNVEESIFSYTYS